MHKIFLLGLSVLGSLGLLAKQDDATRGVTGANGEPIDILIATNESVGRDPASSLRSAYVLLRSLRLQRLDDTPRELSNRAVMLYRDGLKAFESGDHDAAVRYGGAAYELARAVELTHVARFAATEDPELPAPPTFTFKVDAKNLEGAHVEGGEIEISLPPMLNGGFVTTKTDDKKAKDATHVLSGNVKIKAPMVKRADGQFLIYEVQGDQIKMSGNEGLATKREFKIALPKEEVRKQVLQIGPEGRNTLVLRATIGDGDASQAATELHSAYDQIKAARAKFTGAENKVYMDAARDLYNTARREAEAGRHARALELTRAAMALVRVPTLLEGAKADSKRAEPDEIRVENREAKKEGTPRQSRAVRVEFKAKEKGDKDEKQPTRVNMRVVPSPSAEGEKKGEAQAQARAFTIGPDGKPGEVILVEKHGSGDAGTAAVSGVMSVVIDGKEIKLQNIKGDDAAKAEASGVLKFVIDGKEIKLQNIKGDDGAKAEASGVVNFVIDGKEIKLQNIKGDDAGPLVGVGLMLEAVDDAVVVRQIIPGGPAAKAGKIHAGDRLIGIEVKPGERTELKGKELGEIVKLVRGEPGSKVRLVLVAEDAESPKVVELIREMIVLPEEKGEKADDDATKGEEPRASIDAPAGTGEFSIGGMRFQLGSVEVLPRAKLRALRSQETAPIDIKLLVPTATTPSSEGETAPAGATHALPGPIEA